MTVDIRQRTLIDLEVLKTRLINSKKRVKIGFPAGKMEEDGVTSSAQVAAKNEFGSIAEGIPERSFLRSALRENLHKYRAFCKSGLKRVVDDETTLENILELLGQMATGDVKKKIATGPFKPLAPATIRARIRRRSPAYQHRLNRRAAITGGAIDKPLIDTGFMRQNVTYVVDEGNGTG